ncbi:MAG: phytanoyl-CoA dioxygenase family protein, partial [Actinomycetota bacterium]
VLSRATDAFEAIIEVERRSDSGAGDHFAAPGANDRVWNALEKLAVADPGVFVDYYATEAIELAAIAWLGPHYQVTSQINVVNPGGGAQSPHRDYHLGFMSDDQAARFPARAHLMSAGLTLQGAVAHVDMPVASGPTMFLPHSQKYPLGYLAYRRPEVVELFQRRHRQFPLAAGDAVFFNPAVIHAAGCNRTADVRRMANLLQISSPFGRAMESVDRDQVVRAVYPELRRRRSALAASALDRAVAAAAEGYPFPTNLDLDPPLGGLAPPSQADVVRRALAEDWSPSTLDEALATHGRKRRTS